MALFMSANVASKALQSSDTDLAAAVHDIHVVEMLIEFASNMKTEEEFARVVAAASKTCENLEIPISGSEPKRKIQASSVDCVIDRFLMTSSEAVTS